MLNQLNSPKQIPATSSASSASSHELEPKLKEFLKDKQDPEIDWVAIISEYAKNVQPYIDDGTIKDESWSTECFNEAKENVEAKNHYKLNYLNEVKVGLNEIKYNVGEGGVDRPYSHSIQDYYYRKLKELGLGLDFDSELGRKIQDIANNQDNGIEIIRYSGQLIKTLALKRKTLTSNFRVLSLFRTKFGQKA